MPCMYLIMVAARIQCHGSYQGYDEAVCMYPCQGYCRSINFSNIMVPYA